MCSSRESYLPHNCTHSLSIQWVQSSQPVPFQPQIIFCYFLYLMACHSAWLQVYNDPLLRGAISFQLASLCDDKFCLSFCLICHLISCNMYIRSCMTMNLSFIGMQQLKRHQQKQNLWKQTWYMRAALCLYIFDKSCNPICRIFTAVDMKTFTPLLSFCRIVDLKM